MRRPIRTKTLMVITVVLLAIPATVYTQGSELAEIAPERAAASVSPVQAAVRHLPELPEIPIEDDIFAVDVPPSELPVSEVPLPDIPRDAVTPAGMIAEQDQIFFNATLGGGSVNSILGSINVYRLGDGTQFRIGYDHQGADGFNLEKPGTGFFVQENELDGWIRFGGDGPFTVELDGGYADRRFGLQQHSPYYSQDSRAFTGTLRGTYSPETRIGLEGSVAFEEQQRVLSTGDPDIEYVQNTYRRVQPELTGTLEWPRFRVELGGRYDGAFPSDMHLSDASVFSAHLGLEVVPLDGLTLGARGATLFRLDDGIYFPAEGYLSYRGHDRWTLDLSGGYRVVENDPTSHWKDYPGADWNPGTTLGQKRLPADEAFHLDGTLGVTVIPGLLDVRGEAGRTYHTDRLIPENFDDGTSSYPYRVAAFASLESTIGAEVALTERLRLDGSWSSSWEDRLPGSAHHRVASTLTAEISDLTGTARVEMPIAPGAGVLPVVDLNARYEMFRDVEFRLYALDILAPGLDGGRSLRGVAPDGDDPFISAGFQLGAAVRVSF
ncbi:MAG: hypothetical protein WCY01_01380 [Alkalispirochaeta sp.]